MQATRISFEGPGPFDLPVAQAALAAPQGDAVSLSFRVLVDSNRLELVRIAVLNNQALELAAAILAAIGQKDSI